MIDAEMNSPGEDAVAGGEVAARVEAASPKPAEASGPARYIVRYGNTRIVAEFGARGRDTYRRGATVVVRSDRGQEIGEVLCTATERTREYLGSTESRGNILREVNDDDRDKLAGHARREQ